jgi:hypothetical protein
LGQELDSSGIVQDADPFGALTDHFMLFSDKHIYNADIRSTKNAYWAYRQRAPAALRRMLSPVRSRVWPDLRALAATEQMPDCGRKPLRTERLPQSQKGLCGGEIVHEEALTPLSAAGL